MNKKIRFGIFIFLVCLYLILSPILIFYSLGYRFDFKDFKIVSTGGIYLKTWPQDVQISVDGKISKKTGIFSNESIVQGLFPKKHAIIVEKDGYFSWEKILEVIDQEITRVENVTLIKKDVRFSRTATEPAGTSSFKDTENTILSTYPNYQGANGSFVIKGDALFLAGQEETPLLGDVITYIVYKNQLFWLADDGILYQSDLAGRNKRKVSEIPLAIKKDRTYKIIINSPFTFVKDNDNLLILNQKTKDFETYYNSVTNLKFSQDGSRFLYFNDHEIFFSYSNNPGEKILITRFRDKIGDCYWFNNDYVIFNLGPQIKISEIDIRDKINIVDLAQTITVDSIGYSLSATPEIFFDEANKVLYISSDNNTFISEPLTDKNNK